MEIRIDNIRRVPEEERVFVTLNISDIHPQIANFNWRIIVSTVDIGPDGTIDPNYTVDLARHHTSDIWYKIYELLPERVVARHAAFRVENQGFAQRLDAIHMPNLQAAANRLFNEDYMGLQQVGQFVQAPPLVAAQAATPRPRRRGTVRIGG